MIKNLKSKLIICLFLLVTVFSVASSCFASTTVVESPYSIQDFLDTGEYDIITDSYDSTKFKYVGFYAAPYMSGSTQVKEAYELAIIYDPDNSLSYIKNYKYASNVYNRFKFYDKNNNEISLDCDSVYINSTSSYGRYSGVRNDVYISSVGDNTVTPSITNLTTVKVLDINGDVWFDYTAPVDTSFDYIFEGTKRGQTKLSINGLDSSLKMYGYVGCDNNFSVGDTLDTNSISNYLRLISAYSGNLDLYCYLYDGEELLYYIVDENNVILDTGYISEMAKGYFLYGFEVNNGVDFVFLKDGQVYWDNNLVFKYTANNINILQNNNIVSMGQSSYIETNKMVASGTYTGFVYDSSNNLLAQADCKYTNDLSSLSIEVNTSYYENHVGWNKSCYWLHSISLTGYNKDGTNIDFTNYSVRWSIPEWVVLDSITLNFQPYDKRSGISTGFSSTGVLSAFHLQIFELVKDHTRPFNITLQIYDGNDTLVLTHIINSDDIVSNQVSSEENNVDKGDYDILDNPNYTGGSSSNNNGDISNIQNWTADDYINLMSTDNFVWEFFEAILGNLPWWIETPLTILLFGVVIITIIRFARGA